MVNVLDKEEVVFLRTVIKSEVANELKKIALHYSTGRGDWDYGVAIQILIENYLQSKQTIQNEKIDYIISLLQTSMVEEQPVQKKEEVIEFLGGVKINKNTGEVIKNE